MEHRCRSTVAPVALRTRSVPAPTVHRLFNGFLSERGRRGVGEGSEGMHCVCFLNKSFRCRQKVVSLQPVFVDNFADKTVISGVMKHLYIVPVAGAVGALTVVLFVPNAKNDDI